MLQKNYIEAFTDYPIERLGDAFGKEAPVRKCKILSYDGNKYVKIRIGRFIEEVKSGYVYKKETRYDPRNSFRHTELCEFFNLED